MTPSICSWTEIVLARSRSRACMPLRCNHRSPTASCRRSFLLGPTGSSLARRKASAACICSGDNFSLHELDSVGTSAADHAGGNNSPGRSICETEWRPRLSSRHLCEQDARCQALRRDLSARSVLDKPARYFARSASPLRLHLVAGSRRQVTTAVQWRRVLQIRIHCSFPRSLPGCDYERVSCEELPLRAPSR